MAQIDKHAPGTFCRVELGTSDQDGAKQFYEGLFGWQPGMMPKPGVPPHWLPYFKMADADAMTAKTPQGAVFALSQS